jgi:hypothetical protein
VYADEKNYWKDFALAARQLGSPLYGALAEAIDGDEALKGIAARRRKGQPPPNLLLAAVHYLLLKGAVHPLRDYYATLGGTRNGPEIFPLFQDFVREHRDEVTRLVETRVTNTNEVARSSVLRAGFGVLAGEEQAPLHLIEIGPSAGLNMIWDRYRIRYEREGRLMAEVMPEAGLMLTCELKTAAVPPVTGLPRIARRTGLERDPVNLADADDRDWLRALVWPDQPARLQRLDAAIAMFLETPQDIRAGDALELLPGLLSDSDGAVCVYHTIAIYQFSAEMRARLETMLTEAGLRRPVWHLAFELDGGNNAAVSLASYKGGGTEARNLGQAQPHGGWIAWDG